MKQIINITLCFFFLSAIGQQTDKIDRRINNFMNKWQIPGLSVTIINNGKLVYAKGFGYTNIKSKKEVFPNHMFRIGSISKPITAITIFKLIEEDKLSLSDKVFGNNGILNDSLYSKILDKRVLDIDVKQLLEHSAGWDRNKSFDPVFENKRISDSLKLDKSPTSKDIIKYMLQNHYLDTAPGSTFAYSNFGYCILGRIIEKLTGLNYEDAVKNKVLIPLEMFDTKIGDSKKSNENESMYYSEDDYIVNSAFYPFQEKVKPEYGGFDLSILDSCGGWISSAIDLAKLICAIDGFTNRADIISEQSLKNMSTVFKNSNYAKGWMVNHKKNWWHTGSIPGTYAMISKMNDGNGWVILMNKRILENKKFYKDVDQLIFKPMKGMDLSELTNLFDKY
ncbi:serine hydrolase [Aquimarina sp. Aq107]|uniref:serine hydrolase domain-containing protein n=1 Tax=Aquimarina sp. Aq107 TaxID=1191912 RepID=UPI000D54F546|nr:serine hydrolase domain-containing protein [Aquimarina sp. Aq107]